MFTLDPSSLSNVLTAVRIKLNSNLQPAAQFNIIVYILRKVYDSVNEYVSARAAMPLACTENSDHTYKMSHHYPVSTPEKQRTCNRTTVGRSRNHCCSAKAASITYSKSASGSLTIQHAKRMRRNILACGLSLSPIFFRIVS